MAGRLVTGLIAGVAVALASAAPAVAHRPNRAGALSAHQQSVLHGIARDTWRFYGTDIDPNTHLPLDNLGPGTARGAYTSAANIGVYMWAVIAARDLRLIGTRRATALIGSTLREVATLE